MVSANGYSPLAEGVESVCLQVDAKRSQDTFTGQKRDGCLLQPNLATRASIDITVRRIIEVELMEEAAELGRLTLFSARQV